MDLLQRMVEHHVWLLGEMVERAATLPPEVLDRRIEISVAGIDDEPTTRSLLSRLVGQLAMWNAAVANRPYDFSVERDECPASMRKRLDEAAPRFLETIRSVDLDETFVDAVCHRPRCVHLRRHDPRTCSRSRRTAGSSSRARSRTRASRT